jgi:hypothetical protein
MKKRTKGVSPDDADPVAGLADMFADEFGGEGKSGETSAESWEAVANQFALEEKLWGGVGIQLSIYPYGCPSW